VEVQTKVCRRTRRPRPAAKRAACPSAVPYDPERWLFTDAGDLIDRQTGRTLAPSSFDFGGAPEPAEANSTRFYPDGWDLSDLPEPHRSTAPLV